MIRFNLQIVICYLETSLVVLMNSEIEAWLAACVQNTEGWILLKPNVRYKVAMADTIVSDLIYIIYLSACVNHTQ